MALTQISTAGVKDDAVTAGKIPANAVGSSELADNAVDTAAIADDAVTDAKLADNAVQGAIIAGGGIGSGKLAADSVSNTNIIDGNVTSSELATNAVTTAKITDGSVTNDKIAGSTITSAKIANDTLVNADVNSAAAIAGSKISPDFGSQNIVTTGSITGNDLEIDSGTLSVDASNNRVGIGTTSPSTTLSVINDSNTEGFNVKHSNLTQGVGIGYDAVKSTGSSTNVPLNLSSKGTGNVEVQVNGTTSFSVNGVTRDFTVVKNNQGWSTQTMDTDGAQSGALRRHVRKLNNGANSVSTHNLFRLRRYNWGSGHFEVRIYYAYYAGSYMSRWRVMGHGANGDYYSVLQVEEKFTNGSGANWGATIQKTTGSASSPGSSSTYYTDIQATLPNYTYAICELIMSATYQTDNASAGGAMGSNSYTLWTP